MKNNTNPNNKIETETEYADGLIICSTKFNNQRFQQVYNLIDEDAILYAEDKTEAVKKFEKYVNDPMWN